MLVKGEDLKQCTVHRGQQWRVKKQQNFQARSNWSPLIWISRKNHV